MKKMLVILIALISVNAFAQTKLGDLPKLVEPFPVAVDGNDLIFIDEYTIFVYSIEPFRMKARFGQQGDGPHDLKYKPYFAIHKDAIIATDYLKAIWFSKTGDVLKVIDYKEFPDFDPNMEMVLIPVNDHFVRITADHKRKERYVDLYDARLQKVINLHTGLYDWQAANGGVNPLSYRIDVTCQDGKIYITDTEKGFVINVFDSQGKKLRTIDKNAEVKDIPITDEDKTAMTTFIKATQPDWLVKVFEAKPFYYPHYPKMNFTVVSQDRIYVTTYRKRDGRNEVIILDGKGKILDRVFMTIKSLKPYRRLLRFDPYTIHNGRLYEILKDDTTGTWGLYASDVK